MALPFYNWSRVAASNATADSTVNWAEGQLPSSVNDSGRAMMASTAAFRDDISGAITTGGSATAYTVASYQVFDSYAHMSGQMIAFTPHITNSTNGATLNVDGLGVRALRTSPSVEILAGALIQGTPYVVVYNNSDSVFYLHGFYGNPYNVPLAGGMDYWGTTVPNSSFAFPAGQAISRTTYATLFVIMGTTYGTGDGTTTFNLPDKTGRVSAMKEASATRLTSTYFVGNSTALGAVGGADGANVTITQANLPNVNFAGSISAFGTGNFTNSTAINFGGTTGFVYDGQGLSAAAAKAITVASGGSGTAMGLNRVMPAIICNYIIRVI